MNKYRTPHLRIGKKEISPVALAIKNQRIAQGITQAELAHLSGVSLILIRQFEQGKQTVRLDKIQCLLEFLGLELRVLPRGESPA